MSSAVVSAQEICEQKIKLEKAKSAKKVQDLIPEMKADCSEMNLLFSIAQEGILTEIKLNSNTLSDEVLNRLKLAKPGQKFYIEKLSSTCFTNEKHICKNKGNGDLYYAFKVVE